jgi:hypothetical protein
MVLPRNSISISGEFCAPGSASQEILSGRPSRREAEGDADWSPRNLLDPHRCPMLEPQIGDQGFRSDDSRLAESAGPDQPLGVVAANAPATTFENEQTGQEAVGDLPGRQRLGDVLGHGDNESAQGRFHRPTVMSCGTV